ncbi:MAG: hypothetical protein AB7U82_23400 [Blastocatellales bacterium]
MTKTESETISKKSAGERRWHEPATYLIALVLCLWILERLLKLRRGELATPYLYEGDGLFYSMVIKAIITNGWYLTNPWLGAPHGQELYDFPQPDNLSYLLIKMMGLFTSNYATVFNLFYLITFPLTMICTLYVLRKFGVSRAPAILASLLYTFTFYHLSRGQHHLMYVAYFPVPLMVMVILWICSGKLTLTRTENGRTRLALRNPKLIASLLICVLIASTGGAYYSFFAMWLLASAALFQMIRHGNFVKLAPPVFLIIVIFGVFMANLVPNVIYRLTHDKAEAAQRNPAEAEIYGLKIAQLLTPADNHRIKALADFKARYNLTPASTENVDSSLGFIGSAGFLFLIGWLLYRKSRDESNHPGQPGELFNHLSLLNASAVLIGTVGGFGSLFAHLVSPQIRAYNRISVFIAFFSFFAVALLLDLLARRLFQTGSRRIIFYVLIPLLILAGVLDQTKKQHQPDYKELKTEYLSDRDFIRQIESTMPRQAMIFQLPVQIFPEGESYDHLKGYLQSDKLRWSFGAMRGRSGAKWQATMAATPVDKMIGTIAIAGFSGVYIDRRFYPDRGAKIESEISSLIRMNPLVSRNERLSFFSLIEYARGLSGDPEKALYPLTLSWQKDFSDLEGTDENNWRWCSVNGELQIENGLPRDRQAMIEMTASAFNEGSLRIESPLFSDRMRISPTNEPFSKRFSIPPGKHSIRFTCEAPPVRPLPDTRLLCFRINNFKMKEVEQ